MRHLVAAVLKEKGPNGQITQSSTQVSFGGLKAPLNGFFTAKREVFPVLTCFLGMTLHTKGSIDSVKQMDVSHWKKKKVTI